MLAGRLVADVASIVEPANGGIMPEHENLPDGVLQAANEWDADLAVYNSGIPLSPLALRIRKQHTAANRSLCNILSQCNGTPTGFLNYIYGVSLPLP